MQTWCHLCKFGEHSYSLGVLFITSNASQASFVQVLVFATSPFRAAGSLGWSDFLSRLEWLAGIIIKDMVSSHGS